MCSHQDFKQVVFTRNTNGTHGKPSIQVSSEFKKMKQLENDEEPVLVKQDACSVKKQLENGRRLKNLTQTDLAKQLGMKVNDYNRIENGKVPLEGNIKSKIQQILDVKIKT